MRVVWFFLPLALFVLYARLIARISALQHNRLCDVFKAQNPSWDDETLYQEARRCAFNQNQTVLACRLAYLIGLAMRVALVSIVVLACSIDRIALLDTDLLVCQDQHRVSSEDRDARIPRRAHRHSSPALPR